jgi:hypothetical protein
MIERKVSIATHFPDSSSWTLIMNKPRSVKPHNGCRRKRLVARGVARFGLAMLASAVALPAQSWADNRIALVVGNSDYRAVQKLINPVNDAADMAASLTRLGFSVTHRDNLDFNAFRRALIDFGNAARTADKAVIYFAGHGVEIDGKNWMLPVDAQVKSEIDVYAEGINLETLIDISILPKVVGLVVLDACRNNPFIAEKVASGGRSLSIPAAKTPGNDAASIKPEMDGRPAEPVTDELKGGLAPVEVSDNVLVAFAAAAGTTANDGVGRNSPYSSALLRYVEKPGLEINYLFRDVHDDVVKETKSQEPAVYGTLSKDEIYLREAEARIAADDEAANAEKLAWTFVRTTNDVATLRRFEERFPASAHVAEIRERTNQLENAEKFAWTIVERQPSVSAYRAFLELYPYSDRVESARTTLASLEASGSRAPNVAAVDLPKPPPLPADQVASLDIDNKTGTERLESIDKAWDVLRESRDLNVITRFSENYPSLRRGRVAPGSDISLRPVNSTEWMLRTAQDDDVNGCFGGDSAACVKAIDKYPDYVQLRFQLCRANGHPEGCMQDAVEDARQRGYLVSAFTRSDIEIARNQEYRRAVEQVQQNVGNVVSQVVSQVVSNTVSNNVSNAVGANGAMTPSLFPMAGMLVSRPVLTGTGRWDVRLGTIKTSLPASGGNASTPAQTGGPAVIKGSTIATPVAPQQPSSPVTPAIRTTAVTHIVPNVGSRAGSIAAGRAAGQAASNAASHAASRAASHAASNAASRAASNAASRAASNAASRAASNAASNIRLSDIRLKQDIVALGRTADGLGLYRYRYIGDHTVYVGVMAQEVAKRVPAAVIRGADGYLRVDYARLGLEFLTFAEWTRRHAFDPIN